MIVIINGSPNGMEGSTGRAISLFTRDMKSVEVVSLSEMNVVHCSGCLWCKFVEPMVCRTMDDMRVIIPKVLAAEVVVFATPIYVGNYTGLLKTFIDRLFQVISSGVLTWDEERKRHMYVVKDPFKFKVGLLAVSAFPEREVFEPVVVSIKDMCVYGGIPYVGHALGPGMCTQPYFVDKSTFGKLDEYLVSAGKALEDSGEVPYEYFDRYVDFTNVVREGFNNTARVLGEIHRDVNNG